MGRRQSSWVFLFILLLSSGPWPLRAETSENEKPVTQADLERQKEQLAKDRQKNDKKSTQSANKGFVVDLYDHLIESTKTQLATGGVVAVEAVVFLNRCRLNKVRLSNGGFVHQKATEVQATMKPLTESLDKTQNEVLRALALLDPVDKEALLKSAAALNINTQTLLRLWLTKSNVDATGALAVEPAVQKLVEVYSEWQRVAAIETLRLQTSYNPDFTGPAEWKAVDSNDPRAIALALLNHAVSERFRFENDGILYLQKVTENLMGKDLNWKQRYTRRFGKGLLYALPAVGTVSAETIYDRLAAEKQRAEANDDSNLTDRKTFADSVTHFTAKAILYALASGWRRVSERENSPLKAHLFPLAPKNGEFDNTDIDYVHQKAQNLAATLGQDERNVVEIGGQRNVRIDPVFFKSLYEIVLGEKQSTFTPAHSQFAKTVLELADEAYHALDGLVDKE